MIRRYPCQISIILAMGIWCAKAAFQQQYLPAAVIFAAAILSSCIWVRREPAMRPMLRQSFILASAFLLGAARMQVSAAQTAGRADGILDGTQAVVQGRIVKKQFKESGRNAQWVVYLADSYIRLENQSHNSAGYTPSMNDQNKKCKILKPSFSFQKIRTAIGQKKSNEEPAFFQGNTGEESFIQRSTGERSSFIQASTGERSSFIQGNTGKKTASFQVTDFSHEEIRPAGKVIVYAGTAEPVIGNTVTASGEIKLFSHARNEGNFDECSYYRNQGFTFKFFAKEGSFQVRNARKDHFSEACYRLQQNLLSVYVNAMPEKESGVLGAMLLGEKSVLSDEVKKLYQQSGIAHILAISGLHISILGAAAYRLLRRAGASYFVSSAVSMGLLYAFGCMAGMGISTVRAVIMFGLYLGAACLGRCYDSINGLSVAAVCLLLQNPGALFLAGFQFSFLAVMGVLLGKELCLIFRPKFRAVESVLISLGIQMLTLPLTAWYYFEIPVYSVLLNMIVLPFVAAALLAGLLGGSFGLLAGIPGESFGLLAGIPGESFGLLDGMSGGSFVLLAGAFGGVSKGLLGFCTLLLGYFSKAGEMCLKLPGALYTCGRPSAWQMAGYYAILGGCVYIIFLVKKKREPVGEKREYELILRRQKRLFFTGGALCMGVLFLRAPLQAEVDVLDVGQGDGIYIRTSDGQDVFIDGGSTDVSKAGEYRILPFLKSRGISRIDTWFVSHLDKDHYSGLEELVLGGYPIGQVVFAKGILEDEAYQKFTEKLLQCSIRIARLGKGESLRGKNARFLCLSPEEGDTKGDRNADSMVLLYEDNGFSGFFSGDISQKEEIGLAKEGGFVHTVFYKAAHHGSEYSNSSELLDRLSPQVCAVSCSEKNDYGHPGKGAVLRMEKCSQGVHYTMKGGRLRIFWQKGRIQVQEYCKGQPFE